MRVVIVPEDHTNDRFILKPIFDRLLNRLGFANPKIRVAQSKHKGVDAVLDSAKLAEIIDRYPMTDLFVLCVDRDCETNRRVRLKQLEEAFKPNFLAVNAWEELETWALAGLDLPSEWNWSDVRRECDVKEHYFEPLAEQMGVSDGLGGGREILGETAAPRIQAIRQKCPEDFDALARRLENLT